MTDSMGRCEHTGQIGTTVNQGMFCVFCMDCDKDMLPIIRELQEELRASEAKREKLDIALEKERESNEQNWRRANTAESRVAELEAALEKARIVLSCIGPTVCRDSCGVNPGHDLDCRSIRKVISEINNLQSRASAGEKK